MSMKKTFAAIVALCLLLTGVQGVLAESVVGEWNGTIRFSSYEITAAATVTFDADGTYFIKVLGLSSTGTYTVGDESITLTPETPEGIGTQTLYLGFGDGKMYISGEVFGVTGDLQVSRADKKA